MAGLEETHISLQVFKYIIYGPGDGFLAFKTMENLSGGFDAISTQLAGRVPYFGPRGMKRILSYLLSFIYAATTYLLAVVVGFEDFPASLQEGADLTVTLLGLPAITSNTIHASTQLDKEDVN